MIHWASFFSDAYALLPLKCRWPEDTGTRRKNLSYELVLEMQHTVTLAQRKDVPITCRQKQPGSGNLSPVLSIPSATADGSWQRLQRILLHAVQMIQGSSVDINGKWWLFLTQVFFPSLFSVVYYLGIQMIQTLGSHVVVTMKIIAKL